MFFMTKCFCCFDFINSISVNISIVNSLLMPYLFFVCLDLQMHILGLAFLPPIFCLYGIEF